MKLVKNKKHNITYHKETRLVFDGDTVYAFFDGTDVLALDDVSIKLAEDNGFKYRIPEGDQSAVEVSSSSEVESPVAEETVQVEEVAEETVQVEEVAEETVQVEEVVQEVVEKVEVAQEVLPPRVEEDTQQLQEYEVVTPSTYLSDLLVEQAKRLSEYFDRIQGRHTTELTEVLAKNSELQQEVDRLQSELQSEKSKLRRLLEFTTSL